MRCVLLLLRSDAARRHGLGVLETRGLRVEPLHVAIRLDADHVHLDRVVAQFRQWSTICTLPSPASSLAVGREHASPPGNGPPAEASTAGGRPRRVAPARSDPATPIGASPCSSRCGRCMRLRRGTSARHHRRSFRRMPSRRSAIACSSVPGSASRRARSASSAAAVACAASCARRWNSAISGGW